MAGIQIPQTDYEQTPTTFAAGMPARPLGNGETVEHFVASVDIDPGTLVEVVNGAVRPAQSLNGALKPLVGVALRMLTHTNATSFSPPFTTWKAGQQVPVMRKGRIYAKWSGTTQPEYGKLNYSHSSDGTHNQGVFTDAATASTAGAEVDNCPNGVLSVKSTGSTSVCLVELNLPAG